MESIISLFVFILSCEILHTHIQCMHKEHNFGLRQIFLGHHYKITEHRSPRSSDEHKSVCLLQTDSEMSQKGNWTFLNQFSFQKMLTVPHYIQKITSFWQIVEFSPEIVLLVCFWQQTRCLSDVLTDKNKMLFSIVSEEDSKGCWEWKIQWNNQKQKEWKKKV